jgi:hypothetical protein
VVRSGGIRMDNFLVGHDEAAALNYAKTTWQSESCERVPLTSF